MPNLVKTINLTDGDKATLESILHQGTVEARTYIRAKILLLKSEGRSNESIADKLDICVTAVRLCIDKYNTGGIKAALQDNKGRGRKAEITDADITWVINKHARNRRILGIRLNCGIRPALHALSIPLQSRKGIPAWCL